MKFNFSYSIINTSPNFHNFIINKQDGELEAKIYDSPIFTTSKGWKIKSVNCPEIRFPEKTIYLKGSDKERNSRSFYAVSHQVKEIRDALDEFLIVYCQGKKKAAHRLTNIFQ